MKNKYVTKNWLNSICFVSVLVGLMIIFSCGVGNVSATATNTVYVSASGNDTYNGLSAVHTTGIDGPKASIKNAIKIVGKNGTLNIAKGKYTGVNNTNIVINKNLNIKGQNEANTVINGTGNSWIFYINKGVTLNICDLALTNGNATKTGYGAAIYNNGSILVVKNCRFIGNSAKWGGAIYNDGNMTVTGSTFIGNTAKYFGGAIYNVGTGKAKINFNRITRNTAATNNDIYNCGKVDATLNWWGSNYGPLQTDISTSGMPNSWLVLKVKSNHVSITNNAQSTLTADLRYSNIGSLTSRNLFSGIPLKFTTTLGTVSQPFTVNGVTKSTLTSGNISGKAKITIKLDDQSIIMPFIVKDTINPKIVSSTPSNGKINVNRTSIISIKFNENIRSSLLYNKIKVKNIATGKYVTINKSINGNTLSIKTSTLKSKYTWYKVIIPKDAIKDFNSNDLKIDFTLKFKTGT
ncbi:MAG: Ig-like domain-containing protein [Methanobacterium sp. ERen5]|nr:MAG: Ig-like domain-containing protein [Methanobacterium sp. ERen5]